MLSLRGGGELDLESAEASASLRHWRKTLDTLIEKQLVAAGASELKIYVAEDEMRRALEDVKRATTSPTSSLPRLSSSRGSPWTPTERPCASSL